MSALAPHHPPRLSDRDFATQVEDTLQSCTEAKHVRWWVHYKKLAPLLPDTVTEQMLKTYASADTPKMGSFAERGVLVCTSHRQPYFYVFERGARADKTRWARADKTRWAPYELRPILEKISATGASASGRAQGPSARSRVGTIGALGTLQVGTPLQICFQNDEGKREWFDAKVASFSRDFAYEQDGTAAGDAGSFMVDWDDGSVYQRDVPAADFRKNVRLSYYKHA